MMANAIDLGTVLDFFNGKAPPNDEDGEFAVYGSNGTIGKAKTANHENAIILGRVGAYCGSVEFCNEKFWASDNTIVVKTRDGFNLKYMYYRLKSFPLRSYAGGAAQPLLTQTILRGVRIPIIKDKTKQVKIADILSAYDDLIENNRRRIQLLEQAARLLYKEWFVHLRFPGHEHTKIVNGIPTGWQRLPLGKMLTLQRGFDLPGSKRKKGLFPIYASTGINGYHIEAKVQGPGVVTGRSGSLGTVMYVSTDFWPLNTTLWVKEFKQVGPHFAMHLLSSLHLEQYNGGAAVPTLNRNDVHRIEVLCPPLLLLQLFEAQANNLIIQIDALEKISDKANEARNLLLPRLMNGEIDV